MGKWQTQSTVRNYFVEDADNPGTWYKRAVVESTFDYTTTPITMTVMGIKLDKDGNKIETALTKYHLSDDGTTATEAP